MEKPNKEASPPVPCAVEAELGELIPMEWLRKPLWVRMLLGGAGLLLVALGTIGWLMPILPGFVLIPFGILLMAATSRWCAKRVNRLERRMPERTRRFIHHPVHWVEARLPGDWKRKARRPRRRKAAEKLAERSQN